MPDTVLYDTAETILCAGSGLARATADRATEAQQAAAELLLEAVDHPDRAELRHTADVAAMIRDGHHDAARSMHLAYAQAELERDEPVPLDLSLAGVLLEADAWRQSVALKLA